MVNITPAIPEDRQVIDSYGPNRFKVSQVDYEGGIIVFPDKVVSWDVRAVEGLVPEDFEHVIDAGDKVDVLLIGTGRKMEFLSPALRQALRDKGVSVDFMETGAACRTYNILLADGRRVAAALMPL